MERVYVVRPDEVSVELVYTMVYLWQCPMCGRVVSGHSKRRLLYRVRLHLEGFHGYERVVVEQGPGVGQR